MTMKNFLLFPILTSYSSTLIFCSILSASIASALALGGTTTGTPAGTTSHPSPTVKVWDNVITPRETELHHKSQLRELHEFASKSGLGHKCFARPLRSTNDGSGGNGGSYNIIERTLDAILSQIESSERGDETTENTSNERIEGNDGNEGKPSTPRQYVEYWTRQEWRHIEAHSDVDETLAKAHDVQSKLSPLESLSQLQSQFPSTFQNGYRYPLHGHVLYLQVGSEVRGPTCVFPSRSSGGDLLRPLPSDPLACDTSTSDAQIAHTASDADSTSQGDDEQSKERKETNRVQLITVPAKAGRLLRFNGRDLHAVPRPHDLWMLPFVKGGAEYEPEETWGRSVILFNVWPGEEDAPLEVPLNVGADVVDVSGDEGGEDEEGSGNDDDGSQVLCNDISSWDEVPITSKVPSEQSEPTPNDVKESVKVWLLGNERRREYAMRTVPLLAPLEGGRDLVRSALAEESVVSELWLRQP